MEVKEFQEKLNALIKAAKENDGKVSVMQIRDILSGADLDQKQLMGVVKYLTAQGVRIEGIEEMTADSSEESPKESEEQVVPLTPEEQTYLDDYLSSLPKKPADEEITALFERLSEGNVTAQKELSVAYLGTTAELAAQMRTSEVILADLIQEANLSLMQALDSAKGRSCDEAWLLEEVRKGIRLSLVEQDQQKTADDSLVARVERLDKAVRELSDDEEGGGSSFSVNELAIILDMDVEEIKSTLRLTGDE